MAICGATSLGTCGQPAPDTPHSRVIFELGDHRLRFVDPRRFGTGELQLGPEEHAAFLGFIQGIQERADREWYASLMLNRLMFVYFVQKKGFLNGDKDYLPNKLAEVKARRVGVSPEIPEVLHRNESRVELARLQELRLGDHAQHACACQRGAVQPRDK